MTSVPVDAGAGSVVDVVVVVDAVVEEVLGATVDAVEPVAVLDVLDEDVLDDGCCAPAVPASPPAATTSATATAVAATRRRRPLVCTTATIPPCCQPSARSPGHPRFGPDHTTPLG